MQLALLLRRAARSFARSVLDMDTLFIQKGDSLILRAKNTSPAISKEELDAFMTRAESFGVEVLVVPHQLEVLAVQQHN